MRTCVVTVLGVAVAGIIVGFGPVGVQASSHTASVGVSRVSSNVATGAANLFPHGQCTWWANQRYHQLHGVFVPWQINADAWQWVARANQFGWHVSNTPQVGDIIVLQPHVQGASSLGHVGVVERIRRNGRIIVSSMNWAPRPNSVTYGQFTAGPGVAFISM